MKRLGWVLLTGAALAALASVSACKQKPEPTAHYSTAGALATAAPAASEAPPPLTYKQDSQAADVALKLPPEISREPELHRRLYAAEVKDLKYFAENARAEFAEMGDTGSGALPSEKREDWSVAAETSKLLSLRSLTYEFETGGAHPNVIYGAILWDKALKRPVTVSSLFRPGADLAPVAAAICDGVRAESRQRFGAVHAADDAGGPSCPRIEDTPFQLAPSTQAGKAAGLTFLISPYSLGSMSDGPYEVTVPLATFHGALSSAYADEFAGQPAKPKPKEPAPEPQKAAA